MDSGGVRPGVEHHATSSSSRLRIKEESTGETVNDVNEGHDLESGGSPQPLQPNRTDSHYTSNTSSSKKKHHHTSLGHAANVLTTGAHRKRIERLPWLQPPLKGKESAKWMREEDVATEWLNLFYDLVVVAVLTVFSTTHEIRTPYAIVVFVSRVYFTIINWVWSSETRYDIQYQANDIYHRMMKMFQVAVFVYIGVGSGKWNPSYVVDPSTVPGISDEDATRNRQAIDSFITVGSAYAASRGLLAIQYLVCIYQARKAKRQIMSLVCYVSSQTIACIFIIIAVAIPASSKSNVKLGLLYASIAVETIAIRIQFYLKRHGAVNSTDIAERYGALTLIILGEGFISIIRAMNDVIAGLDTHVNVTYAQLVCAVIILAVLWHVLFGRFDKSDNKVSPLRALFWEVVHFPLHFSLLLLLAAMVNTIINLSVYNGVEEVVGLFDTVLGSLGNGTAPPAEVQTRVSELLVRLDLQPTYDVEYDILKNLSEAAHPVEDPLIVGYQYYGQVLVATFESYGVELEDDAEQIYENIYAVNTSTTAPDLEGRRNESVKALLEMSTSISKSSLSGETWLFPAAGGVLVSSGIRSFIWYRFDGIGHWVVHIIHLVTGIILCLLGLLDIGPQRLNILDTSDFLAGSAPIYTLLETRTPLVVVTCAFVGMYLGTMIVLEVLHRYRGGIYEEERRTRNRTRSLHNMASPTTASRQHSIPNIPEEHEHIHGHGDENGNGSGNEK